MITEEGIVGIGLIVVNSVVSYFGLRNQSFLEGYCFEVDKILVKKDFKRLITSGFLHVSWMHLIFNMFSLYVFSRLLELSVGHGLFFLIYMVSLVSGNLLALFIHRHHGDYKAIGASGAVSGIIFSSIALFPGMEIGLFFIPLSIPSWVFGLGYIMLTIYGIRSKKTNIGHEAHLGGALGGMLLAIGFYPESLTNNYLPILVITVPSILFIILIAWKPQILIIGATNKKPAAYTIDDRYNEEKIEREKELDRILEKIHQKGMDSLTTREKKILEEFSAKK